MKKNKIPSVKIALDIKPLKNVKLVKLSNETGTPHPNGIEEGYTFEGMEKQAPMVGESYILTTTKRLFMSSEITQVLENGVFKTANSIYKIEYV